MVVINRDAHQQGRPSGITVNITNHINLYFPSQTSDNNRVHSATMDTDVTNGNQEEEEEEEEVEEAEDKDDDDNKTITGNESDDSDHSSNYQTPPTSDDDNEDDHMD